jgi:hypothetical protein
MADSVILKTGKLQMKKETDDKIALEMVNATQVNFPGFNACSFDKGFHSLENQRQLKDKLEQVVLPKKGRLSSADKVREYDEEFVQAKRKLSAVESAINALQVHGLNFAYPVACQLYCRVNPLTAVELFVSRC